MSAETVDIVPGDYISRYGMACLERWRCNGANVLKQDPKQVESAETTFEVRGEYITLGQLLKMTGAIATGGEAKYFLAANPVVVNNESEQRRGRKLRAGDSVLIPGESPIRMISQAVEEAI